MRLLKIGRDASCDIVLYSEGVSSLHAELTLLNNGDIQLEDKGSRNGTFVMNQPIKPGKPVNIRRGDAVRFADVELQWSQVPMPEDNSAYKAIYGIGSHFNNDIQISGNTVSRYHATIKVGRDGKVYIVDHSKNGTTIDGHKIASNVPTRIKKSSAVVCGGVPVNLKASAIQWPSESWKMILGVAASLLVLVGVGFGLYSVLGNSGKPSMKALEKATACVFEQYYIQVTYKDDPFVGKIASWPEKWTFGIDSKGNLSLGTPGSTISPLGARGTAFFISKDGEMGTNRHIALPWEYLTDNFGYKVDLFGTRLTSAQISANAGSELYVISEGYEANNAGQFATEWAVFKKSGLEMDDGVQQYEFEFFANDMEYSYDIDVATGNILSREAEAMDAEDYQEMEALQ